MDNYWKLWGLPIAGIILTVTAPAWGLSPSQVAQVAKAVTVEIKTANSIGSGVLVAKNAQGYTVLTAAHVVRDEQKYQLIAPDGRSYGIDRSKIKILPGADLALVSVASTQSYRTVKVRQANAIAEGSIVYVGGFPLTTQAISKSLFNFTEGRVTASSKQPLQNGYGLVYTNMTLPGMSGGSVLNEQGELIAIHGRGDVENSSTASTINPDVRIKTGFNLGILANVFVPLANRAGLKLETVVAPVSPTDATSECLFSVAVKMQAGEYRGAIAELDRLIAIAPQKATAYYLRANAYMGLGNLQQALPDFNRAIELDPKNPQAYFIRGNILDINQNSKAALADYDRAILLDPRNTQAYLRQALIFQVRGDSPGALAAYTKMIAVDPQNSLAYSNRAGIRADLRDYPGAIEDFSQMIRIEPENINAYDARANLRRGRDPLGAIADYSKMIQISPNNLNTYSKRANVYRDRKEWRLALQDYITMSKINPNDPEYYKEQREVAIQLKDYRAVVAALDRLIGLEPAEPDRWRDRGEAKLELKDTAGAIADYRQAIELYRQQPQKGNAFWAEQLTEKVRELTGKN